MTLRLLKSQWMLRLACASCVGLVILPTVSLKAQETPSKADPSSTQQTEFAPGVVTVIPPAPDPKETFDGPLTLDGLLDAYPEINWSGADFPDGGPHFDPRSRTLVEMAKQVILRREIYCFEFSFKPLRQIYIDVPRPDGRMQRKLIWYMVYRVRYRGGDLRPAADEVGGLPIYNRIETVSYESRRFFPMMVLRDPTTNKQYVDRVLPTAKQQIATREKITAPLFNTVEISRVEIAQSNDDLAPGTWGVVTWEDVDPNIDFLTVSVFGLTNAFEQDGVAADSPYRRKALELNFYRPGDSMNQTEDLIRFGVPAFKDEKELANILKQYGLQERLDYRWVFR
jgi:hypothetical protein